MAHAESTIMEGTPEQLAALLGQLPREKRYRLMEVKELEQTEEDPTIALLKSWIAEAPTDPEAIREAEEELREFKRNMNLPRKETGARLHYPEVE